MQLIHPISSLLSEADVRQNSKLEYTRITFNDGYIITDEQYIYDILMVSRIISVKEYNEKNWEKIISYEKIEN